MSTIRLSKDEMADWTGAKTRAGQFKFLVANGIQHHVGNDGWPVVRWASLEPATPKGQDRPRWSPNKAA